MESAEHGYTSPWWGTYDQIIALGGQVRSGERHAKVVWWKQWEVEERSGETGETERKRIPLLRYSRVFNAAQADGLPERYYPPPPRPAEVIDTADRLAQAYLGRPGAPRLTHAVADEAFYLPGPDVINVPPPQAFTSPERRYAVSFHEIGHSTGHGKRLARPGVEQFDHFGSGKYSREELVAEMSSAMLCAVAGIDTAEIISSSADYIGSWLAKLRDDVRLVVTASYAAQRAADYVQGIERQPDRDQAARDQPAQEHDPGRPAQHATSLSSSRPPRMRTDPQAPHRRAAPADARHRHAADVITSWQPERHQARPEAQQEEPAWELGD
jgi:antirestriction protein ArdC